MKKEWYMISTISGKEAKVIETLLNKIKSESMEDKFDEIKMFDIPTITDKELIKKAQGKEAKVVYQNMYKGYIFVKTEMTDEVWFMIRNTDSVTGLIGSSGKGAKPSPISQREIDKMIKARQAKIEEFDNQEYHNPYMIDVIVKIKDGPFKEETGKIIETNFDNQTATVEIKTFGRITSIEFPYKKLNIIKN